MRAVTMGFVGLVFPAIFLAAIYALSFYLLQSPVWFSIPSENALADPAWWMSLGHFTLGISFFLVALTNRAHGTAMAVGHVALAWAAIAAMLFFAARSYGWDQVRAELMPSQVMVSFFAALFLSHLAAIFVFDLQRGVPWWKAPLISGLMGPLFFVLIFYPLGHAGMDAPWGTWMWMHYVGLVAVSLIMMLPFAMLRRHIKPGPGLGGA